MLRLDGFHPSSVVGRNMDLYDGDDSAFHDIGSSVHMLGYPNFVTNAAGDCISGDNDLFHYSDGKVTASPAKKIKLKADNSAGQSGSPLFFCPEGPDDTCGSGEKAKIIGINAGQIFGPTRAVGPKASSFRELAVSIIADN
jgi:hypothetical protein